MSNPTESNGVSMAGRNPNGTFKEGHSHGFKPGQSGNPNGRKNAISDIFNELLDASHEDRTVREAIAERMITIARTGNAKDFFNAFDRIIDRTEGRALERVEQHVTKDEIIIE